MEEVVAEISMIDNDRLNQLKELVSEGGKWSILSDDRGYFAGVIRELIDSRNGLIGTTQRALIDRNTAWETVKRHRELLYELYQQADAIEYNSSNKASWDRFRDIIMCEEWIEDNDKNIQSTQF